MKSAVFILEPAGGGATTASPEEVLEDLAAAAAAAATSDESDRGIDFSMHRSSPSLFILLLLIRTGESGRSERGRVRTETREEEEETIEGSALGGDARMLLMFFFHSL